MKKAINRLLHLISVSIITIMLGVALLLLLLNFLTPYLASYRNKVEQIVREQLHLETKISHLAIGNRGLEPVLELGGVTVYNESATKALFVIPKLRIGIDLIGSLLNWRFEPGLLELRGMTVDIVQNSEGGFALSGIKGSTNSDWLQTIGWLLSQGRISLRDINLSLHLANGKTITGSRLFFHLENGVLQHDLIITGDITQAAQIANIKVRLQLRGDLAKQNLSAVSGSVWIQGLTLSLSDWVTSGHQNLPLPSNGELELQLQQSQLKAAMFRQPVVLQNLSSKLRWQNSSDSLQIQAENIKAKNDDLQLHGNATVIFPANQASPKANIKIGFLLTNLARAKKYYPVKVMPSGAVAWLDPAFITSKAITGIFTLQGSLADFPFDHNEGKFLIDTTIRDVHLHYQDGWPDITNINGKLVFVNRSMIITADSAKVLQAPTLPIKVTIPDLERAILNVDGGVHADSSLGKQFVIASPLKATIGNKLQLINLTGPMQLRLLMQIPLSPAFKNKLATQVDGLIDLQNNYLHPFNWKFGIEQLQGKLHFTADDLTATGLQAKVFNQPIALSIATLKSSHDNAITQVNLAGSANIADIANAFNLNPTHYLSGNLKYSGVLALAGANQSNSFTLSSDLQGVAVNLPAPFAKSAAAIAKFRLAGDFSGKQLPTININYNNQIDANLLFTDKGDGAMKLAAGAIMLGGAKAAPPPEYGVVIAGNFQRFAWDEWRNVISTKDDGGSNFSDILRQINLRIAKLTIFSREFNSVTLQLHPDDSAWKFNVSTPDVAGTVTWPKSAKTAPIVAKLQKLYLSADDNAAATAVKPQELLPLHLTIAELHSGNKIFHGVELITEPQPQGLKIEQFAINDSNLHLNATGDWVAAGNKHQSSLHGTMQSDDIGDLLKNLGLTKSVAKGKGEAKFALSWLGVPYQPNLATLSGNFSLNAKDGRIINLSQQTENELGFGRVLNLLSLQTLSRRLTLDFSDLTTKGFSFDNLTGAATLDRGNALVSNLVLDGPVAQVKVQGKIGLKAEDYDMTMSTTPHVTSSAPVIAAIAGGPVVGAIAWVADKVISSSMQKMTTYNYHITGSWQQPVVEKI